MENGVGKASEMSHPEATDRKWLFNKCGFYVKEGL